MTRRLSACGAVGAPLFLTVILVEGASRPGYDPVRELSSALSLGERGWIQITNFVVTGLLMIAFAAGLRRALHPGRASTWGLVLIGCYGVGLVGAGVFVADPYRERTTWHGILHNAFSVVVFLSLAAACLVLAARFAARPRQWPWAVYSAVTGVVLPPLQPLLNSLTPGTGDAGLIQRVTIAVGWGWVALLAVRLITRPPRALDCARSQEREGPST